MNVADPPRPLVALITHPRNRADDFARRLVEGRIAACANLVEVRSIYRWQGAVEEDPETMLVIKTTSDRVAELEAILETEHPYDVPELVLWEPEHVKESYLAWLLAATRAEDEGG